MPRAEFRVSICTRSEEGIGHREPWRFMRRDVLGQLGSGLRHTQKRSDGQRGWALGQALTVGLQSQAGLIVLSAIFHPRDRDNAPHPSLRTTDAAVLPHRCTLHNFDTSANLTRLGAEIILDNIYSVRRGIHVSHT